MALVLYHHFFKMPGQTQASPLISQELPPKALEGAFSRQNKKIHKDPYILFGPEKCYLPRSFTQHWGRYDGVEVREDDVWLCSFPKCGKIQIKIMSSHY